MRRHVDSFQPRGAKTVDLHSRAGEVPTGLERRHFGNDRALFAHRRHHAHDHVVYLGGVEVVAALQLGQYAGQQIDRFDLVEAAVLFTLAARGANGVIHKCFSHGSSK